MEVTKISQASITDACEIPFFDMKVQAGSPSPADGHMCNRLDLNRHLIKNPNATFFVQVTGESMIDAGIKENDLLVVDRAIEATNNKIVITAITILLLLGSINLSTISKSFSYIPASTIDSPVTCTKKVVLGFLIKCLFISSFIKVVLSTAAGAPA